jgi:hypothetical protein
MRNDFVELARKALPLGLLEIGRRADVWPPEAAEKTARGHASPSHQ